MGVRMQPAHWSMLGLIVDVVGAFLLSAEAIKTVNLLKFRDHYLNPVKNTGMVIIYIFKPSERKIFRPSEPVITWPWLVGIVAAAAVLLSGILELEFPGFDSVIDLFVFLAKFIALFVVTVCGGLLFLGLLALVAQVCITLVGFLDDHTADGVVGIIGFFLLMAGFGLQFYGTYLSLDQNP